MFRAFVARPNFNKYTYVFLAAQLLHSTIPTSRYVSVKQKLSLFLTVLLRNIVSQVRIFVKFVPFSFETLFSRISGHILGQVLRY